MLNKIVGSNKQTKSLHSCKIPTPYEVAIFKCLIKDEDYEEV